MSVSSGAWVILTALVLLRLRRIAILATAGLLIWYLVATAGAPYWVGIDPGVMLITVVSGLELAALLASAGPRQGIPLMTWRYYALAVLVPAAVACVLDWVWPPHPLVARATVITLVAITLAGMAVATPLSRRVALALSIPAYYLVVRILVLPSISGPPDDEPGGGRSATGLADRPAVRGAAVRGACGGAAHRPAHPRRQPGSLTRNA